MRDSYDYIIIGAGSAGCAVANQLSADPAVQVLLVEAGPSDKNAFVSMPRGFARLFGQGSRYIWNYEVNPGGNKRAERWFKGKVIGGSSSVNGMLYMRGSPRDYDAWEAIGCSGWGWSTVGPIFKGMEDHELGPAKWRGVGGPVRVSLHPVRSPLHEAVIEAAGQMGVPRVDDINDADAVQSGCIGYQPRTIAGGKRFSAANAFLDTVTTRANLHVVTETQALKISFDGRRATSVRLRKGGEVRTVFARREIVVSCGALETPKLLQLSGIGRPDHLTPLGIEVVSESPDVGRNLLEHRHFDLQFRVTKGSSNKALQGISAVWEALKYFFTTKGAMAHAAHELGGYAKTDPALDHTDIQFNLFPLTTSLTPAGVIALDNYPGITFLGYQSLPQSQGELRIQSADPDVPPHIDANHLDAEIDRQTAVALVKWMRRLSSQPALEDWIIEEKSPGLTIQTDDDILAHAMEFSGTAYHVCGTARMGADAGAVVDSKLRVRGVTGLRIADTSIMPTLVAANTNAVAMMIGIRAGQLISAENKT